MADHDALNRFLSEETGLWACHNYSSYDCPDEKNGCCHAFHICRDKIQCNFTHSADAMVMLLEWLVKQNYTYGLFNTGHTISCLVGWETDTHYQDTGYLEADTPQLAVVLAAGKALGWEE